jgi:hypothetical protein
VQAVWAAVAAERDEVRNALGARPG